MPRSAVAPDGTSWGVGRRWVPFRVRLRDGDWREGGPADLGDVFFDSPGGVLAGLAVIATAMLVFLVIWPIVAIALELVLLALIFLVSLAGRVLFRRPWTVVARSETTGAAREHTWRVVGWRASARLIEDAVDSLSRDGPPRGVADDRITRGSGAVVVGGVADGPLEADLDDPVATRGVGPAAQVLHPVQPPLVRHEAVGGS